MPVAEEVFARALAEDGIGHGVPWDCQGLLRFSNGPDDRGRGYCVCFTEGATSISLAREGQPPRRELLRCRGHNFWGSVIYKTAAHTITALRSYVIAASSCGVPLIDTMQKLGQKYLITCLRLRFKKLEASMPLFFVDFHDGGSHHFDDVGHEFADIHGARDEAINTLFDAAWHPKSADDQRDCQTNVSDESGKILFRARLSLTPEWKT